MPCFANAAINRAADRSTKQRRPGLLAERRVDDRLPRRRGNHARRDRTASGRTNSIKIVNKVVEVYLREIVQRRQSRSASGQREQTGAGPTNSKCRISAEAGCTGRAGEASQDQRLGRGPNEESRWPSKSSTCSIAERNQIVGPDRRQRHELRCSMKSSERRRPNAPPDVMIDMELASRSGDHAVDAQQLTLVPATSERRSRRGRQSRNPPRMSTTCSGRILQLEETIDERKARAAPAADGACFACNSPIAEARNRAEPRTVEKATRLSGIASQ